MTSLEVVVRTMEQLIMLKDRYKCGNADREFAKSAKTCLENPDLKLALQDIDKNSKI